MDNLSRSLESTIANSALDNVNNHTADILIEQGEEIMDRAIEGAVSELPVIKLLLTVPKLFQGVSNYLLIKKIVLFLTQLNSLDVETRRKFIEEMDSNKKGKIFENLILVLDKADNMKRATLIGELFKALAKKQITEDEFYTFVHISNTIDLALFGNLKSYYAGTNIEESTRFSFMILRLIDIDTSTVGTWGSGGIQFKQNALGKKYLSIVGHLVS